MFSQMLIILLSLAVIVFGVPIVLVYRYNKDLSECIWPMLFGIASAVLMRQVVRPWIYFYLSHVFSTAWHTKIGYGFLFGLAIGFFDEFIRFAILIIVFERKNTLIEGTKGCISFGLGQGWASAFMVWGLYLIQLINVYLDGNLNKYGLVSYDLVLGLVEVVTTVFLHVGMTLLMQYGLVKGKAGTFAIVIILYHSLAIMLLYYIEYLFEWPAFIAQFVFAMLSVGSCLAGYYLLKSEDYE